MRPALLQTHFKLIYLFLQEEGQDLVEYALVVALVAIVAAATLKPLGTAIALQFTTITGKI